MSSSRFPGKVLSIAGGIPLIDILLSRLSMSKELDHVVIATSNDPSDDALVEHLKGQDIHRGSLIDVRSRYIEVAKFHNAQNIIRVTADCPLVCPEILDKVINLHINENCDYVANCNINPYPKGFDVEVFKSNILRDPGFESENLYEKEHVTPWMYSSKSLKILNLEFNFDKRISELNFSVDTPGDLNFLNKLNLQIPIFTLTFNDIYQRLVS
jgi:spore coat polysaccharide biosynthesis protein SpsF (cytidylyltransferase family)